MKRQNHLFDKIVDYQNLREAWLKAIRGKRKSSPVLLFYQDVTANLKKIQDQLSSLDVQWGPYQSFIVTDPKERVISAASFPERIMHHAITNVLEPYFEKHFITHSYACRKNKGTHAAVMCAFDRCKSQGYFCKLDMRKYFDSIDHLVLKKQLRRLFKDERVLFLLDGIIDSYCVTVGRGVPIGNLTSQFFANYHLSGMDHFILEKIKPTGYVRYMDDFVLWHSCKDTLKQQLSLLQSYIVNDLHLELKQPILGSCNKGVPFLGFLIKDTGIFLLKKSRKRMIKQAQSINRDLLKNLITEEKAGERATSVNAAVLLARCQQFRVRLWQGSGFG